ncbi:hypothetical protein RJ55_08654 [Drechmeria coniospora]|nr:hypothetical protein RJ55_08654 [Drechmeria coniospora]
MTLMPALGECMRTTAARSSTRVSLSRRHPLALREAEEDDEGPSRPVPPNPSRGPRSVLHAGCLLRHRPNVKLLALRASPVPSATPLHSMPPGQQGDHGLRLGRLPNELVSRLQLFAGLILTVVACVLAVIRFYVLDLVIPKVYSARTLEPLNDGQRRGFVNHHVAAGTKIFLIIITCYPLLAVLSGGATPQTPFAPGMRTTLGDVLVVSAQVFTAMYIFELFYREKISPIGCAHHVGAIVIAQTALAMNVNFDKEPDSIYELLLCFIWGAFDVVAELWPHVAMIVYRIHTPKHLLLARTFYATMALELVGTTVETAVVMWIFGSLWDRWSLSLKIATPILHTLFSAAQLWSARIFYKLAREQRTKHLYE